MTTLPFELPRRRVADANDLVVETRTHDEPAPPQQPVEETPPEQLSRCVIIGPSGVGKTALLLAMERACSLSRDGEPDLAFLADRPTSHAFRRAKQQLLEYGTVSHATREPETYRFQIRTRLPEQGEWFHPLAVEINDGPGGALFENEQEDASFRLKHRKWRSEMLESLRQADSIVLCINAVVPRTNIWQRNLGELLAEAATTNVVTEAGGHRWTPKWFRRQPRQHHIRAIKAQRVLVLVTKIDQLASRTRGAFFDDGENGGHAGADLAGRTHLEIAERIDPVWLARELMGVSALTALCHSLMPESAIAAGSCSAGGFNPAGRAFWLDAGHVDRAEGESDEMIVAKWTPYGVREGLFFLGGESQRPMATLRAIERTDLYSDSRATIVARPRRG